MTDYFEVIDRDGSARLGELRLDPPLRTPAIGDERIVDGGSSWSAERAVPEPRADAITILPHRGMPPGTPAEIAETFAEPPPDFEGPAGAAVAARTAADLGVDLYALSSVQGIVGHAAAFRETMIAVREAIPDDTALYCSGVATPANVGLLAYAGVDVVDTDRARIAGTQGTYLTPTGARSLEDLSSLPCPCPACRTERAAFDRADCAEHNVAVLRAELAEVRERIRRGSLRDFVSARVRHEPWLTAALRQFDEEGAYLERHAPVYRRARMEATTDDDLFRPAVTRFMSRVAERYTNRFDAPLVLLPCSAAKPYSESQSHGQFRDAIGYRAHMVSLSSPIGVVPQELECTYPAQHYDIPVTGRWTATERAVVSEALETYLTEQTYPRVIAHVPPGPYRDVVERAADGAGVDPTFTVADHPTTDEALSALDDALAGEHAYARADRRAHTVRAIADYQFGPGGGDDVFQEVTTESPYPKHRVRDRDGTHLATMVPEYGLLALTIAGGRRWSASATPTKSVSIDAFVPHGNVLAPGVREADPAIRVGDEVVVRGPSAFAVGRARMHGSAMEESIRGIAVDVRHTEDRTS